MCVSIRTNGICLIIIVYNYVSKGNDNLHLITDQDHYQLRIKLSRFNGDEGEVVYGTFKVGSANDKYRLTVDLNMGGFTSSGAPWGKFVIIS